MSLCDSCTHILHQTEAEAKIDQKLRDARQWRPKYTSTGSELLLKVKEGCSLCIQIWNSFFNQKCGDGNLVEDSEVEYEVASLPNEDDISLNVRLQFGRTSCGSQPYLSSRFKLVPEELLARVAEIPSSTDGSFAVCKKWLQECMGNHDLCRYRMGSNKGWLPTRLLDTGIAEDAPELRVVLSERLDSQKTPYLALSHCWGVTTTLTLSNSNLEDLQNGISWESIPRTFHDAIAATRALGYRYIWIDSLCIIQDSLEDWQFEASLMNVVYGHATCVLAAADSTNSMSGLFRTRDPVEIRPVRLKRHWFGRDLEPVYVCIIADLWLSGVDTSVLNERGWVLQERTLAPRTIHFSAKQLFWECRQLEACEVLPEVSLREIFRENYVYNPKRTIKREGSRVDILKSWFGTIEAYSKTKLTKSSDKLVAIGGVAREVANLLSDQYFAGLLWGSKEADFVNGMLWEVDPNSRFQTEPPRKSLPYRSPSWSWASIDGMISLMRSSSSFDAVTLIQVLDIRVEPLYFGDIYGEIKSAKIKLKGVIKEIQTPVISRSSRYKTCGNIIFDDHEYAENCTKLFAVPLQINTCCHRDPQPEPASLIRGMIITPIRDEVDEFERVGSFTLKENENISFIGSKWDAEPENPFGLPEFASFLGSHVDSVERSGMSGDEKWRVIRLI